MKLYITIIILLNVPGSFVHAQITRDCETYFNKILPQPITSKGKMDSAFQLLMPVLRSCGGYDKLDSQLIVNLVLEKLLFQLSETEDSIRVGTVFSELTFITATDGFQRTKKRHAGADLLGEAKVNLKQWQEDSLLIRRSGLSEWEIQHFHLFLLTGKYNNASYRQALNDWNYHLNIKKDITNSYEFRLFSDLNTALSLGKAQNKTVLIYFEESASVNCRKIEQNLLRDPLIQEILNSRFVAFKASLSDIVNGKRNIELLTNRFSFAGTPFFVTVSAEGNMLSRIAYTQDRSEFISFLESINF